MHCYPDRLFGRPRRRYPAPWRTARALRLDLIHPFVRAGGSLRGAGFLDGFLDRFPGFAGAFLNPAQQFFLLAFGELEIVIRELGPLLLQLTLGDVPVAFDFECVHSSSFCCCSCSSAVNVTAKLFWHRSEEHT